MILIKGIKEFLKNSSLRERKILYKSEFRLSMIHLKYYIHNISKKYFTIFNRSATHIIFWYSFVEIILIILIIDILIIDSHII